MKIVSAFALSVILGGRVLAAEAGHLEPVSAFDRDDYIQIVYQRLVGKHESTLWMICLPSFESEYAVVIRGKRDDANPKRVRPIVEVARAETPVYGWEEEKDGRSRERYDEKVSVTRTSKPLAEVDVDLLATVAFEVLKKTRPAESPTQGCDGETFVFCFDQLAGRIWSPSGGEPALLERAWAALAAYVRAKDEKAEENALADFRSTCARIQRPATDQSSAGAAETSSPRTPSDPAAPIDH